MPAEKKNIIELLQTNNLEIPDYCYWIGGTMVAFF